MNYQSEKADSLGLYVRKTYHLHRTAQLLYDSIRWLEIKNSKLCGTVFAGYREIAHESRIDIKSVKAALQELQMRGLVEVTIGYPIKREKVATSIRRKTLDEIKAQSIQGNDDACKLAAALSKMAFQFGDKVIKPRWTVGKTGRVCSSNPNIQCMDHSKRLAGLKDGLKEGHTLVYADIEKAEPTIIKHLLKIPKERDLYCQYMDATGCLRSEAKVKINMLAYCKNSLGCFRHWNESAQTVLGDYVRRLADYKKDLFVEGRKYRSIRTISGRLIVAEKGVRLHAGKVMNWRVQGTVADIVNAACLRLLDSAVTIVPVHDALYAVVRTDKASLVEASIIDRAREVGLTVKVKTEVHSGLTVSETTTAKVLQKPVKL